MILLFRISGLLLQVDIQRPKGGRRKANSAGEEIEGTDCWGKCRILPAVAERQIDGRSFGWPQAILAINIKLSKNINFEEPCGLQMPLPQPPLGGRGDGWALEPSWIRGPSKGAERMGLRAH